jgi:hypothetical protein
MPNGITPMIGDADDGRGYIFDESAEFWDFRDWLAVGAVLCERSDYKFVAQGFGEAAFWLLGPEGLQAFQQLERIQPKKTSISFPHGGHYVFRDNWSPQSDFAFFKCGSFGLGGDGFCAHSHCDLLSFVLCISGKRIIVDSGTYTYHGLWRDRFRLTAAHNSVKVDGNEQAKPFRRFGWKGVPQADCLAWEDNRVVGSMLAAPGVKHQRQVNHPKSGTWYVIDNFQGEGEHEISWFFHFAPSLYLRKSNTFDHLVLEEQGIPLVFTMPPSSVQVHIENGWFSSNYGHKEPNPLLRATWSGRIPIDGVRFEWRFEDVRWTNDQRM